MIIWTLFDVLSLSLIVVVAGDALRRMRGHRQPFRALAFVVVATGSFGAIAADISGAHVPAATAILHLGICMYAVLQHRTALGANY